LNVDQQVIDQVKYDNRMLYSILIVEWNEN